MPWHRASFAGPTVSALPTCAKAEKIWRASLRLDELVETILSDTRATSGGIGSIQASSVRRTSSAGFCREQIGQEPDRPFQLQMRGLPGYRRRRSGSTKSDHHRPVECHAKYSQPDQAIEVTARKRAGMIRIVVQDHGIGIPERDLPFIMQPFFRGQNG